MDLTLILGPMKGGKTYELISFFAPLSYTNIKYCLYQSARNVRDSFIESRNGAQLKAKKIARLSEILDDDVEVVGIDEIHMFEEADVPAIETLLRRGVRVVASGLDTDYQGKLFIIIAKLIELCPRTINYHRAVCELCRKPDAVYTQILKTGEPVIAGLPPVVPDDGSFTYRPACRSCFVK